MGGIVAIAGVVITFAMGVGTYYVRTMQKNQYQQMEFLTANIASQIGAAVEMLDEISLQLSNNVYVTDTFSELYGSQGQENAFTQMLAKDAEMQSFMWSYILKRSSVYRICLLNGTNDFTYVGTAVDYQFLQPASTVPFAVQLQADFAQNGKDRCIISTRRTPIWASRRNLCSPYAARYMTAASRPRALWDMCRCNIL